MFRLGKCFFNVFEFYVIDFYIRLDFGIKSYYKYAIKIHVLPTYDILKGTTTMVV